MREKKRILRLLITDVTLVKSDKITVHVRLSGGASRTLVLDRPLPIAQRACRKLLDGLQIGLGRSRFYALLTSESPKQNPSSRFCSWTVQAPAKPNPLRSHSMASNPWMDRRAVLKL